MTTSNSLVLGLGDPFGGFLLSFGGQNIPLVKLGSSGNNVIMAGNISMFAGQTGELRLGSDGGVLDNIQFSLELIPEPSAFALFALGALLFLTRLSRRGG